MLSFLKFYFFLNNLNFYLKKKIFLFIFSSGQDSVFLLFCLHHLSKKYIKLHYCHHFLQPSNFLSFWQTIKWSYCLKKSFFISISEKKDKNYMSEKEARFWRYNCIIRNILIFNKNLKILSGHTGSDLLETYFWYIFRYFFISSKFLQRKNFLIVPYFIKTFPLLPLNNKLELNRYFILLNKKKDIILFNYYNLENLSYKKSYIYHKKYKTINFLKKSEPLKNTHRQDISYFCKILKIPVIVDKSNNNLYLYRNRIRHLLFPLIGHLFQNQLNNIVKIYARNQI